MKPAQLATLVIPVCAALWGLYWVPLREMEEAGVSGGWVMALFSLPALVGAGVITLIFGQKPTGADQRLLAIAGIIAGSGLALYGIGLIMTSVVRATMLFYLTPVWGTVFGVIFLSERPGPLRWLALATAIIGLVLILGLGAGDLSGGFGIGEVFGLASGVLWAIAATLIRRSGSAGPALSFWLYAGVIGTSVTAALMLRAEMPSLALTASAFSPFVLVMSGLILISFYGALWGMSKVSPGRSGVLMMSEVLVAVLSAAVLLPNEVLSASEWAGVIILIGAGLLEAAGSERQSETAT